jgi:hypothetical protein
MTWIQLAIAVPALLLVAALVHDFLAGLGEERLWSDPAIGDPQSFAYRKAAAEVTHRGNEIENRESSGRSDRWDLFVPVPQS